MALYCAFTLLFASCVPTRQFNYFIIQDAVLGFLGPIFLQTLWKNILVLEDMVYVPSCLSVSVLLWENIPERW